MLEILSLYILQADPWWIIFFALVLIAVDWILINSEVFLVIGIAALKFAMSLFFFKDFAYILWLIPFFLFTSFYFQRALFSSVTSSKLPDENLSIVGMWGTIKKFSDKNQSKEVFFSYDTSIEKTDHFTIETANVVLADGRSFTVLNASEVSDGDHVKITSYKNGLTTVKRK